MGSSRRVFHWRLNRFRSSKASIITSKRCSEAIMVLAVVVVVEDDRFNESNKNNVIFSIVRTYSSSRFMGLCQYGCKSALTSLGCTIASTIQNRSPLRVVAARQFSYTTSHFVLLPLLHRPPISLSHLSRMYCQVLHASFATRCVEIYLKESSSPVKTACSCL